MLHYVAYFCRKSLLPRQLSFALMIKNLCNGLVKGIAELCVVALLWKLSHVVQINVILKKFKRAACSLCKRNLRHSFAKKFNRLICKPYCMWAKIKMSYKDIFSYSSSVDIHTVIIVVLWWNLLNESKPIKAQTGTEISQMQFLSHFIETLKLLQR